VGGLGFRQGRGVVYRATTYDTPLWVSPNRRPGRWNNPDDRTIAQYFALDPASALAEMVRAENLRDLDEARELRVSVWELRLREGAIVDYTSAERARSQGFSWRDLTADGWEACQEEGQRIVAGGGRGVLAPSGALGGGRSLTIFGPRTEIAWASEPTLAIQIPARHVLRGQPGDGLVRDTRFFGDPYPDEDEPGGRARLGFSLVGEPAGERQPGA
jgi:RES domain-containing protein